MAKPALRVVDGFGEVIDAPDLESENRALRAALTRAENVIKGLRQSLAAERQKRRSQYPVDEAFEDWRHKMVAAGLKGKGRCRLTDDRVDAMTAIFEAGYTLEDFRLANTGIAAFQYVNYGRRVAAGKPADHLVDLAWVCEKARRFEEAARLGAIVGKQRSPDR